MKKQILSKSVLAIAVGIAALSLTACGGGDDSSSNANYSVGNTITAYPQAPSRWDAATRTLYVPRGNNVSLESIARSTTYNLGRHYWVATLQNGTSKGKPSFSDPQCSYATTTPLGTSGAGVSVSECATDLIVPANAGAGSKWVIASIANSADPFEEETTTEDTSTPDVTTGGTGSVTYDSDGNPVADGPGGTTNNGNVVALSSPGTAVAQVTDRITLVVE